MKKGEIVEGVIEEVKFPNKGVMSLDGVRVEVKNTLPGQKVKARVQKKRNGSAQAALVEVTAKAPDEMEPPCPAAGVCGGCTYLSLPYDKQLSIKQVQVMKLLQQGLDEAAAFLPEDDPHRKVFSWYEGIFSSPKIYGFRNKMEFSFGDAVKGGPLQLGMHQRGSFYDIADAGNCVIVDADYRKIVQTARDFFARRNIPFYHRAGNEGYLRHLIVRKGAHTGQILVDLVTTTQWKDEYGSEEEVLADFAKALKDLDLEGSIAGILRTRNDAIADVVKDEGTDILYGTDHFEENLLGLTFEVTPFSFFQPNSYSAEVLYQYARNLITDAVHHMEEDGSRKAPVIYDLYCGTGTISQMVSSVASEVIGVEIVPEAVEAAKKNARRNHIENCTFLTGDVLTTLDTIPTKPDLIILDPPRDGVHPKALPKILHYNVPYILYISCKPTSLARDLPAFIESGYVPVKGASIDQFAWSSNIESITLFTNNKTGINDCFNPDVVKSDKTID